MVPFVKFGIKIKRLHFGNGKCENVKESFSTYPLQSVQQPQSKITISSIHSNEIYYSVIYTVYNLVFLNRFVFSENNNYFLNSSLHFILQLFSNTIFFYRNRSSKLEVNKVFSQKVQFFVELKNLGGSKRYEVLTEFYQAHSLKYI